MCGQDTNQSAAVGNERRRLHGSNARSGFYFAAGGELRIRSNIFNNNRIALARMLYRLALSHARRN